MEASLICPYSDYLWYEANRRDILRLEFWIVTPPIGVRTATLLASPFFSPFEICNNEICNLSAAQISLDFLENSIFHIQLSLLSIKMAFGGTPPLDFHVNKIFVPFQHLSCSFLAQIEDPFAALDWSQSFCRKRALLASLTVGSYLVELESFLVL